MVALDVNETSKVLAVTGGYIVIFGLIGFFLKERFFMSEALIATAAGIIFGPLAANFYNPLEWVNGSQEDLQHLTRQITRIIIAIQVLFTGISLPKAYLRKEWMSLTTLLLPIMTIAWFVTGLLVWGLIPGLNFLEALVIGSCVTPTDPVLANSICKGRFAEKHVPLHVRNIIVAEAGANDGLGFPFLYLALYLILIHEPTHPWHSVGGAVLEWFYNIVLFQIVLSVILGVVIGYIARKVLRFAEERNLIDHESFLSFGVALTFFTLGIVGTLGSDDILCCFVVGNSFTWDDWFRVQIEDHAFQDVIDQLLNTAIFLYIGSVIPWSQFGNWYGISPWRLVVLGICVMLLRRLPWVMALSHFIPALPTWRESAFAGFFGPIGVGAIFYVQVALDVLPNNPRNTHLHKVITPVVYFLVLTSIIVHGITIPVAKGFQRARTLTISRSQTANTGTNMVSRLPAPVPFGMNALQDMASSNNDADEAGDGSTDAIDSPGNGAKDGNAIRFHLPRGVEGFSRNASEAALSDLNTPISSRPPSPERQGQLSISDAGAAPGILRGRQARSQSKKRAEVWQEGRHTIIEDAGGEGVRVIS